jgi:mannose-6-phosphate isomerase-like protein (cupin superfamily)
MLLTVKALLFQQRRTALPNKRTHMKLRYIPLLLATLPCAAQTPQTAPGQGAQPQRQVFVGLNEVEQVSIDRYIGDPESQPVHLSHGTLLTHEILGAGDPNIAGPQDAVLEYRKLLATADLMPGSQTPLETYPDEYFFYVKSGEGRLDDGKQYWDLRSDMAILVPPSVAHRIINTSSDKPLSMIMLQWTAGPNAKKELIVRDTRLLPWCEENAHWNNTSRCIFSTADGLLQGERIYTVMLQPWSVSQPHSHTPGTEEIWTKITPGTIPILMGSDLREMKENTAYLVPPTGKTDHSNLNLSKDKVEWWIYVARGPAPNPNAPPRPQGQQNGGRPSNPNLSRDTQSSTVAGKPLR